MNTELVTVATHSEGLFNDLIKNDYKVKVKVLGFGKKWTGFKMKTELVYDYIKDLQDNKIIIFLDGFDSIIRGTIQEAERIFKENNYKILASININAHHYGLEKSVFPTCKNDEILNCGLYMGYVKYLKILLKDVILSKCKDDQVVMNQLCKKHDFIDIDSKEMIFKNIYSFQELDKSNALFFSKPGMIGFNRIYRGIFEYGQFFMFELIITYFALLLILLKSNYKYSSIILTFVFGLYIFQIDKSCIN